MGTASAEKVEAVSRCFSKWDASGEGVLSYRGLCQVLLELGLGEEVANSFIAETRCISYLAFVDWAFGIEAPSGLGLSKVFASKETTLKFARERQTGIAGAAKSNGFSEINRQVNQGPDLEFSLSASAEELMESAEVLDAEFAQMCADLGGPIPEEQEASDWDQTFNPQMMNGALTRQRSGQTMRASSLLTGTHGMCGLKTLSVSAAALAASKTLGASHGLNTTLSASDAVHGSEFTWVRGDTIGAGSMGSVFKALDQSNGQIIAVKEVGIDERNKDDMKFRKALENEISIIQNLRHPRIVSFFGSDCIEGNLYVYLEFMPGGSVAQVLIDFGALDECLCAPYTRDVVEGLEYLHSRSPPVQHRDIKCANILVSLDGDVKLTDFGCSKRTEDTKSATMRGSIPWMAPEVIKQSGAGRSADIWSLGCIVIEMATGKLPWGGFDNHMAAMYKIGMSKQEIPIPESLSAVGQDFIRSCVQRDKTKRLTAADLLKHEFMGNMLVRNLSDM